LASRTTSTTSAMRPLQDGRRSRASRTQWVCEDSTARRQGQRCCTQKHIRFTPEMYEKLIRSGWKTSTTGASRPARWGPSHTRMALRRWPQNHVARVDPAACAHCGSEKNHAQETDVLDTHGFRRACCRFPSSRWPNITAGKPRGFRRLLVRPVSSLRLRHSLFLGSRA